MHSVVWEKDFCKLKMVAMAQHGEIVLIQPMRVGLSGQWKLMDLPWFIYIHILFSVTSYLLIFPSRHSVSTDFNQSLIFIKIANWILRL